jgi:hypothetical protein
MDTTPDPEERGSFADANLNTDHPVRGGEHEGSFGDSDLEGAGRPHEDGTEHHGGFAGEAGHEGSFADHDQPDRPA